MGRRLREDAHAAEALGSRSLSAGVALETPLYKEVERLLIEPISSGAWKPGAAIPSERSLATRFEVALGTVRKAVDELVARNILVRQQGRGTFVATHNRERQMFHFFHIVGKDGAKETPAVELMSFGRGRADSEAAARLAIAPGSPTFEIRNVLKLAGRPVILDAIVLPHALFPTLTLRTFRDRPNTIYHLYQFSFGITVLRTLERLSATKADAEAAASLRIARGAPLLQINRTALTFGDVPVELRCSLVNTAAHEYFSDLSKVSP